MNISGLICTIIIIAVGISLTLLGVLMEKKNFNKGICTECGSKLRLFAYDSHGGRGYCCTHCVHHVWGSYNCVDRKYKEKENDI